ncbi:hypothetical protein LTR56_022113 [Elasticomyces elasticus]|nr:hypothetical protein LTR56_022113 [Elasticomyces elasticus]KAK3642003.1 hypothetical protein LTR22_016328 [Elasticomyces elasticus]KAK4910646.1 hypothetical protein LTR49_020681 [Elasticomyces elasticus]KAK5748847.1 hypothetical protein LTS12_021085 [Elasticomyces elasticus]
MAKSTPTLMGLLVSVRETIYSLTIEEDPITYIEHMANRVIEAPLLYVNRKIRHEALPVIYRRKTFLGCARTLSKFTRAMHRTGKLGMIKTLGHDPNENFGDVEIWTKYEWLKHYADKVGAIMKGHCEGGLTAMVGINIIFPLRHEEAGVVMGTIEELGKYTSQITLSSHQAPTPPLTDMADIISPFMRLPPEIRNFICDLVLVHDEPITLRPYGTDHIDEPALLRTSHQLRQDARPIYFGMNTFVGSVYGLTRFVRTVERNHKLHVLKHLRCDNDRRDLHDRKVYGSVDHLEQDHWLKDHIDSVLAISARLNKNGMTVSVPRIEFPLRHGQAGIIWGTNLELQEYDVVVRSGQHTWVRSEQNYQDVAAAFALFAMIVDAAWDDLPTV